MKKKFALLMTTALVGASLVGCGAKEDPSIETNPIVDEIITEENIPEDVDVTTEDETAENIAIEDADVTTENDEKVENAVIENKPVTNENSTNNKPAVEDTTPTTSVESMSAADLYAKVTADIEFPMQMELDEDVLRDLYNIDTNLLKSFKVQTPMMSAHISEIGIFELKDAKDADKVIEGIQQRADSVGIMLYPSLQETYDARQIVTVGNYVLFVMDDNANIILDNFKAVLN